MRATTHKHQNTKTSAGNTVKASRKSRKAVKAASAGFAAVLAAAAFIVPTTTMAPGVEAYADSRISSYSVGDINKFSGVITGNCAEVTTAPAKAKENEKEAAAKEAKATKATEATKPAGTAKANTTPAATAPATTKAPAASVSAANGTTSSASSATGKTAVKTTAKTAEAGPSDQSSVVEHVSSNWDYESYSEDYGYSYSDDDYGYSDDSSKDYVDDDSYYESDDSVYYSSGSALVSISNPDYSYSPRHVSLSSYDRDKLERLVMGEAGTMGYTGAAIVAQAIRDSMVRSNTTSIDRIISEYQYFGSTNIAPNSDVKAAVSYIFDQDGIAVQHRVMCFYIGSSAWHETQIFLCELDGVRFFDLRA